MSGMDKYLEIKIAFFFPIHLFSQPGKTKGCPVIYTWRNGDPEKSLLVAPWDIDQLLGAKFCFFRGDGDMTIEMRIGCRSDGPDYLEPRGLLLACGMTQPLGDARLRNL